MSSVVVTPHTANTSENVRSSSGALAARNAELFVAGECTATAVDIKVGY